MAGLVFACVMPHGLSLIPELSPDAEGALATRAAMEELGRRCAAARPEVIIVATPHGVRVQGAIALAAAARATGILRWRDRQIEMNVPLDAMHTDLIAGIARLLDVPVALTAFGGNLFQFSQIPLDWATMVPLWFLGHGRNQVGHGDMLADPPQDSGPPVVIVTPSRQLPRNELITFGRAVAEAAAEDGRRIAFVASCDWSHTHLQSGPYGYHPTAAKVDRLVVQAFRNGDPGQLIRLTEEQVASAAIDGLWQTLMLAGVLEHTPMRSEVLSYEVPSYYGMLVAAFEP